MLLFIRIKQMIDVTGKNLLQERLLREMEALSQEYPIEKVPIKQNIPDPIYKQP